MEKTSLHGMWSSRLAFILAATGSAVGLGNIWRFPYLASDNGGGAFVLVYLACIFIVGLPVLIAEILIGRHGRRSPITTLGAITRETGASKGWTSIGWIGIVAGVLILSFYSVVGGWTLRYAWLYLVQLFGGTHITDPAAVFGSLLESPTELLLWHALFMGATVGVVALGVEKGLERAVRFLMPALFLTLLLLVAYGATTGHLGQAAGWLFRPDWSKVDAGVFVAAMGQAFFTLSLGMCAMMTYGAYLPRDVSIPRTVAIVAVCDTTVALMAGLAIFPIVIAFGISPEGGGPGLIFTSLPLAFEVMTGGIAYGLAFFALLFVAAWTSSISLLEPATAYMVERGRSRKGAAILVALVCWALGLLTVFSFNLLSHVRLLDRDLMGLIELIANDIMLPVGGLLIALFAGWVLKDGILREQLAGMPAWGFTLWRWLLRILCPLLVAAVLINALF